MSNYYEILKINRNASKSDIKKAYHKLSKKYHPDKNKDENAKVIFQQINEAYSILSDEKKKGVYDKYGKEGLESMGNSPHQGMNFPFHVFNNMHNMGNMNGDFEIPGLGRVRFQNQGPRTPKSPVLQIQVGITLEEAYKGTSKEVSCNRKIYNSKSDILEDKQIKFKIDIPAGAPQKTQQFLRGKGHLYKNHQHGDLVLLIYHLPHSTFKYENNNLILEKTITLAEAILGFNFSFIDLQGKNIIINEKGNIKDEEIKICENLGFVKNNKKEPLIIKYNIKYPKTLEHKEAKYLKKIFGYSTIDGKGVNTIKLEEFQKKNIPNQGQPECVHQ
jgi:DnaJ family protein B protein 4